MLSPDLFDDSAETVDVEVLDTVTDSAGRVWAFVVESRHALVLLDNLDESSIGVRYQLRPDLLMRVQ